MVDSISQFYLPGIEIDFEAFEQSARKTFFGRSMASAQIRRSPRGSKLRESSPSSKWLLFCCLISGIVIGAEDAELTSHFFLSGKNNLGIHLNELLVTYPQSEFSFEGGFTMNSGIYD